jgi:UDP-N-acetylglucosamine pyrophosphorylase
MPAAADQYWVKTQARVICCKYQFARMNTLTLGIPTDANPFLITFTYSAQGKTYTDRFTSPTYIQQGETFSLSYNPLDPQQNTKTASSPPGRGSLFAVAVVGSVILSIVYLAWMRGCN